MSNQKESMHLPAEQINFINSQWDNSITPLLCDYIRIPNKSPTFDHDWASHGYIDQAVELIANWCRQQPIRGLKLEILRLPQRTPLLFMEIPGDNDSHVLFYGHLDKQPEMSGWRSDLGPWKPVLENNKLYGRGGADDGYAVFSCLTAIQALQNANLKHPRCTILIESSEESGSPDLPPYLEYLGQRLSPPDLVICLDSGTEDYDRLWGTISLRGIVKGTLQVSVTSEGVHSGAYGGVIPSSFMILRQLLDRIENSANGEMRLNALKAQIPDQILQQVHASADVIGPGKIANLPLLPGVQTLTQNYAELILNNSWHSVMEITGADGLPDTHLAGNVLRPTTAVAFSMRIPPNADPHAARRAIEETLLRDPPFQAKVAVHMDHLAGGWCAPPLAPWLAAANESVSQYHYGNSAAYFGEGGSIPFMGMLGERFPQAQFLVTGVLGPQSNAHGPNEFLHIPYAKRLTACIADITHACYQHKMR